ncbi:DNA-binding transcriptional regulator, LysR family [Albimonas pacifica]|uniref:DNA-binding transcriptional regulator, LysR family n=1 Tax=Albimonas pacifica TaxID=1114924 RepID=A0A1I3BMQ1_9RHOB|nr:DNA-binding transcriptional regulator, LysR family [Albimonas pacifica]
MPATIKQLHYICAVADSGSIMGASDALRIAQSSITAAIEAVEHDLGARVFDRRRGRGARLTPQGERFMQAARRLLSAERRYQQELSALADQHSELRIGCFEPFASLFVVEVLSRLRAKLPNLKVSLVEGDQPRLKRFLERGELDLLLAYDLGPDFEAGVTEITPSPPHALVSAAGPFAARDSVSIAELAAHPFVLLSQPLTVTYLLTLLGASGLPPVIGFRSRSYDSVLRAVAAGFGNSVLNLRPPKPLDVETGCLRLPLTDDLPAPMLIAVDNYGDQKPRVVRAFMDELHAYLTPPGATGRLPGRDAPRAADLERRLS